MAVELQGHRGARGVLPENTLPGFEAAIAAGVDALELDIAITRDAKLVVAHDPTLAPEIARCAGSWIKKPVAIQDLTVKQLRMYDVGRLRPDTAYAARFAGQQPVDGLSVPLLTDLLAMPALQAAPHIILDIEIKTNPLQQEITGSPRAIADALLHLIDTPKWRHRSRIRSFDWRALLHVRRVAPAMTCAFLTAEQDWLNNLAVDASGAHSWLGGLDLTEFENSAPRAISAVGGRVWAPYYQDLSSEDIVLAHELGLQVIAWTVNDADDMRRMLEMSVDGITTDYPELGRRIINELAA